MAIFAAFETNVRRERQLEGIAMAKRQDVYTGANRASTTIASRSCRPSASGKCRSLCSFNPHRRRSAHISSTNVQAPLSSLSLMLGADERGETPSSDGTWISERASSISIICCTTRINSARSSYLMCHAWNSSRACSRGVNLTLGARLVLGLRSAVLANTASLLRHRSFVSPTFLHTFSSSPN